MANLAIEAEPYELEFDPKSTALIIIDMQRDFVMPGGFGEALGNDVTPLQATIAPTARVLAAARKRGMLVVHTREGHRPDLTDCPPTKLVRGRGKTRIGDPGPMGRILVRGEIGHDIVPELYPRAGEPIIDKPGKGAFYATGLGDLLAGRQISHLILAGVTTEVCVQTTMREANDRGYECLLAEDATESYFPQFKAATLDMIRAQGAIVGWTATVDAIAAALEHHHEED